jgi:Ca-activated chloride channel family protein
MEAKDLLPSRLDAAKETAKEFVNAAPSSTRIAVVSFSGNSYIHQRLTGQKDMVIDALNSVEISPIEGTDIYEVVITSSNLLIAEEGRSIILLSDGQINVGEVEDAIKYANQNDIVINTIAVGTKEGGETVYGVSKLNEDVMKALSYNTEGNYFDASDRQSLLNSMDQILKLSKKKVSTDLSGYLVIASIILFVIEYVLINSRYRLLPF